MFKIDKRNLSIFAKINKTYKKYRSKYNEFLIDSLLFRYMYMTIAAAFAIAIITNITFSIINEYDLQAQEGGIILLAVFYIGNLVVLYYATIYLLDFLSDFFWVIPASIVVLCKELSDWYKGKKYTFLTKEEIKGGYLDFTRKGK